MSGLEVQTTLPAPIGAQHDLTSIVLGSSAIVQMVLLLLVGFSVGSLAVILYKFRQIRAARSQTERFLEIFWEAKNLAAIHGTAVGGGLELVLHCDVRFAAQDASLGQPEINIGFIPPVGGTQGLARLPGRTRALRLL